MSVVASRSAVVFVLMSGCQYPPYAGPGGDDDGVELTEGAGATETDGAATGTAPGACEDACEAGAAICEADGVVRCGAGDDGCLAWLSPEACPEGQACSDGACGPGSGFVGEPAAWAVPAGGRSGEGFSAASGQPQAVDDDAWEQLDLDGDGALDLVRTATAFVSGDGFVTRNSGYPGTPFWQVHRGGGGEGFAAKPQAWLLPVDVGLAGRGLVATAGEPEASGDVAWALRDLDGDARPDLVITGVRGPDGATQPLGPPDAPRWDVHLNNGHGFAPVAQAWALPQGPDGAHFHHLQGAAAVANGPAWALLDLDGDGWSDLVVTGRAAAQVHVVPGFPDSPYWELHRGGPGGFVVPLAVWKVPVGGGVATGFVGRAEGAFGLAEVAGDQLWELLDLDGDGRVELVVTGQLDDSAAGPAALDLAGAPGWAAYRAGDTGFELSPRTVALPSAGGGSGGRGYYAARGGQSVAGVTATPYDATGWELLDLDGDGYLDLAVTNEAREVPGGSFKRAALGGEAAPYWDVYPGTASGFAAPTRWSTPRGGFAGRGFLWTRGPSSPVPESEDTALWHIGDLDGDGLQELIVTALGEAGGQGSPWVWRVPGLADAAPHWRIHWQWSRE